MSGVALIVYGAINPDNEYSASAWLAVFYDEAGNLAVDEAGRQYFYDDRNRGSETGTRLVFCARCARWARLSSWGGSALVVVARTGEVMNREWPT